MNNERRKYLRQIKKQAHEAKPLIENISDIMGYIVEEEIKSVINTPEKFRVTSRYTTLEENVALLEEVDACATNVRIDMERLVKLLDRAVTKTKR